MNRIIFGTVCVATFAQLGLVSAKTLEKVDMADTLKVETTDLVLNGMGLRKVSKFGIPIKVYVGGLYLQKKSADSKMILNSADRKRLVMQFVRPVDRDSLIEAFRNGYENNCQAACDNKDLFTKFKDTIVSVREGNRIIFDFTAKDMTMESTGPNGRKDKFDSPDMAKNVLALFINDKAPPTPEFRQGLLGL
jgi:hypothetical protein